MQLVFTKSYTGLCKPRVTVKRGCYTAPNRYLNTVFLLHITELLWVNIYKFYIDGHVTFTDADIILEVECKHLC